MKDIRNTMITKHSKLIKKNNNEENKKARRNKKNNKIMKKENNKLHTSKPPMKSIKEINDKIRYIKARLRESIRAFTLKHLQQSKINKTKC